jgi:hypothetical protein
MIEVRRRDEFVAWLAGLRDKVAAARISARIDRLATAKWVTWNRSVRACRNCGSITVPATAFTSPGRAGQGDRVAAVRRRQEHAEAGR